MKHAKAVEDFCTERYVLGEMTEQERSDFEEHFFDCAECADDVRSTVAFADNVRAALGERAAEDPGASGGGSLLRFPGMRSRTASALAAAAVLVLAVGAAFQSLVVVPDLRRQLAEARAPQAVGWEFLAVARSAVPVLEAEPDAQFLGLRLSRSFERTAPSYVYELLGPEGNSLQSALLAAPAEGEELGLLLPLRGLAPGAYVIVLSSAGSAGEADQELARYPFELRFSS